MANTIIPLDQTRHAPATEDAGPPGAGALGQPELRGQYPRRLPDALDQGQGVPLPPVRGRAASTSTSAAIPMPYLDVILVNASADIAKSYYEKGYTEGDMELPRCWSLDSVKPHASVAEKVHPVCGTCPMNQFGSRVTDAGKNAKACQDQRRVAITLPHHLTQDNPTPVLMRVPQSSLKSLKAYSDTLAKYNAEINGVITRLSFEPADAFPRLKFEYAGIVDDEQYDKILDLAEGQVVTSMLSAPMTEPAEENLTEDQKLRTPAAASSCAAAPGTADERYTVPCTPAGHSQAAPQAAPAPAPAPTPAPVVQAPPPPAAAPPAPAPKANIGVVDLGGKFYNPITQEFCNADGSPLGSTPVVEAAI